MFFKKKFKKYFLKDNLHDDIQKGYVTVGKWSYGKPNIFRWDWDSKITIGNFCSIGPNVTFYIGGDHRIDWVSTSQLPAPQFKPTFVKSSKIKEFVKSKGDIEIGNDVWIGGNTLILSGVKIGTGAVIAAGSVVTNDVEPYQVSGGNPNRLIKKRFNDNLVSRLLNSKWWDLDDKDIDKLSEFLLSNNIELFLDKLAELKK